MDKEKSQVLAFLASLKNFITEILFPQFCLNCGCEGIYLCQDCLALLDILENQYCLCKKPFRLLAAGKCNSCRSKKLNGLYFAVSYQNGLVKKLIHHLKYEPFVKELSKTLAFLIITYLSLSSKNQDIPIRSRFSDFVIIPVPLHKKRLKWRGFNQAEEIGNELATPLGILLANDVLIKTKETLPQIELSEKEREENIKGAFLVKEKNEIKDKRILLVDDVYTTGATMEECARLLKEAGAKEVWGMVVARG